LLVSFIVNLDGSAVIVQAVVNIASSRDKTTKAGGVPKVIKWDQIPHWAKDEKLALFRTTRDRRSSPPSLHLRTRYV
jgi:hypothetical protein